MSPPPRYVPTTVSLRCELHADLLRCAHERGKAPDVIIQEALQSYLRPSAPSRATAPISVGAPPGLSAASAVSAPQRPLYLTWNGALHIISKPRFTVGRERDNDLFINDSNVSRYHCEVLYEGGEYKIVDLKSTNGVDHQGQRVPWRHISEGDEYFLCEHKISFSFRQP